MSAAERQSKEKGFSCQTLLGFCAFLSIDKAKQRFTQGFGRYTEEPELGLVGIDEHTGMGSTFFVLRLYERPSCDVLYRQE